MIKSNDDIIAEVLKQDYYDVRMGVPPMAFVVHYTDTLINKELSGNPVPAVFLADALRFLQSERNRKLGRFVFHYIEWLHPDDVARCYPPPPDNLTNRPLWP